MYLAQAKILCFHFKILTLSPFKGKSHGRQKLEPSRVSISFWAVAPPIIPFLSTIPREKQFLLIALEIYFQTTLSPPPPPPRLNKQHLEANISPNAPLLLFFPSLLFRARAINNVSLAFYGRDTFLRCGGVVPPPPPPPLYRQSRV